MKIVFTYNHHFAPALPLAEVQKMIVRHHIPIMEKAPPKPPHGRREKPSLLDQATAAGAKLLPYTPTKKKKKDSN